MSDTGSSITDFGMCKPLLQDLSQGNKVYGVLPYVAPEVLKGKNYTQASDVYSFGIIMIEVITGFPPFYDFPHNENLAISICEGLRPTIGRKIPKLVATLIDQCLDADPTKRISAEQLKSTLDQYYTDVDYNDEDSIICKQVKSCAEYDPNYNPGIVSGETKQLELVIPNYLEDMVNTSEEDEV
ncbi:20018_t:CDS:2 [Funneliformis geosporum]|uniref:20018_t:CDS:1 n=1 Tax=Funneliformis geosporum TaxID=1117311 RepID=A0A9W4SUR3_9GLOM|nr:20018_t:CDS:2 [Funneliformis geosporum]